MMKRTFFLTNILFFLFTACHKEQTLPPIVKKSHNYENELKRQQGFSLVDVGLECIGSHSDLFDSDDEFGFSLVNPPACYTPDPTDVYYLLINIDGSDVTFNLEFYKDVNDAITAGEIAYTTAFSYAVGANVPISQLGPNDVLNLYNTIPNQEYNISCKVTFTDFDCVYEKTAEFTVERSLPAPIDSPLQINVIDETSLLGNPFPPNPCGAGANAIAIIVP